MGTERWLLEEARNEEMALHIVDVLLFESALADSVPHRSRLLISMVIVVLVCHPLCILSIHLNLLSINSIIAQLRL
jgi:hypothetical protein